MVVENKSTLIGNDVRKNLIEITKKNFIPRWITIILLFIFTLLLTINALTQKVYINLFLGAIFLFFDLFYFIKGIQYYRSIPSKIDQDNEYLIDNTIVYHYKFKEQSFILFAIVKNLNRRLEYKYQDIHKVYEFHDRFEFKLKDNTYLYLYKNSFITEKGEEFLRKNFKNNKVKVKYIK